MSLLFYVKNIISKFRSSEAHDKNVFDHYFFDLKYYLNKDASVEHFADLLNSNPEKLDRIAHTYYIQMYKKYLITKINHFFVRGGICCANVSFSFFKARLQ